MSQERQDKTRIQQAPSKPKPDSDKTRIKSADRAQKKIDATRIKKALAEKNLRVQAAAGGADPEDNQPEKDSTRIRRKAKPTEAATANDKTRVAPARKKAATNSERTQVRKPKTSASTKKPATVTQFKASRPDLNKTRVSAEKPPVSSLEAQRQSSMIVDHLSDQRVLKSRFVLEKVLGAGGMGVVYKARDRLKVEAQDRDPYVAIKVLSEEFKTHPEAFISLQRESRKSQRIAHPNIVNVHDFDRDGDTVFMTMEFLDGEPLDELITRYQSTGLPTDDTWEILNGMMSALLHAHAENIIHSDFKPGNVFVTRKGQAKVFDFGIARAVAQAEHLEGSPRDVTVFDAGNLGALTPAYASLEMLQGAEPDVRDDVYALGCVAYEMFTGSHPYNKVPADEAERQGLKPKKIGNIKKYQWKAIEKAIAFRRQDRLASVEVFKAQLTPTIKSSNWMVSVVAILIAIGISTYFILFNQPPQGPTISETDIRNEVELQVRMNFYQENIDQLINDPGFTQVWQNALWNDISEIDQLTLGQDAWVAAKKIEVYELYVEEIDRTVKAEDYDRADQLIEFARRYGQKPDRLNEFSETVAELRVQQKQRQAEQEKAEQQRQQQLTEKRRVAQVQAKKVAQQQAEKKQISNQFDVALGNANKLLECHSGINMRDFETAVKKLRQLDGRRYRNVEAALVKSLGACIRLLAEDFPARAQVAKDKSLRLFDSELLASIVIKSKDPCDKSLAGKGSQGKRAICRDKLESGGYGPDMVVIPGNQQISPFALGKFEVSVGEFNRFCKATGSCSPLSTNQDAPVTGISVDSALAYVNWLGLESGKTYRLPRKSEWLHAAKSRKRNLDPNRNCELSTRGFQKGDALVNVKVGKQNAWGLLNYVGNAQEWVYHGGRNLLAMGGSFRKPMEECTITTSDQHSGKADDYTGFRVLREIGG